MHDHSITIATTTTMALAMTMSITLANTHPEVGQAFIQSLLQPLASDMLKLSPCLGADSLASSLLLCLFTDAGEQGEIQQRECRSKVVGALQTFAGVLRHAYNADGQWQTWSHRAAGDQGHQDETLSALASVVWPVLPAIEQLLQGLDSVSTWSTCSAMLPRCKLVLYPAELLVLTDPEHHSSCAQDYGDVQVSEIGTWLRHTREACYDIFGQLTLMGGAIGFFDYLQARPSLLAVVLGHCAAQESRHVRLALRHG